MMRASRVGASPSPRVMIVLRLIRRAVSRLIRRATSCTWSETTRAAHADRLEEGRVSSMCHSDESRPPRPPVEGVAADRYDLTLTASDWASFMAYAAVPEEPSGRSVVILPDFRGLHAFYKEFVSLL